MGLLVISDRFHFSMFPRIFSILLQFPFSLLPHICGFLLPFFFLCPVFLWQSSIGLYCFHGLFLSFLFPSYVSFSLNILKLSFFLLHIFFLVYIILFLLR